HLRRDHLGDGPTPASVPEEAPDQVPADQHRIALGQTVAALAGHSLPGGNREREDSLTGFRYVEAKPGHFVAGWHVLHLGRLGQAPSQDDHVDRDHAPSFPVPDGSGGGRGRSVSRGPRSGSTSGEPPTSPTPGGSSRARAGCTAPSGCTSYSARSNRFRPTGSAR